MPLIFWYFTFIHTFLRQWPFFFILSFNLFLNNGYTFSFLRHWITFRIFFFTLIFLNFWNLLERLDISFATNFNRFVSIYLIFVTLSKCSQFLFKVFHVLIDRLRLKVPLWSQILKQRFLWNIYPSKLVIFRRFNRIFGIIRLIIFRLIIEDIYWIIVDLVIL